MRVSAYAADRRVGIEEDATEDELFRTWKRGSDEGVLSVDVDENEATGEDERTRTMIHETKVRSPKIIKQKRMAC